LLARFNERARRSLRGMKTSAVGGLFISHAGAPFIEIL
jgi:hypothetical protein